MRYTYSFKMKCLELYRKGEWPPTPDGVTTQSFHNTIIFWHRLETLHGPDILRHQKHLRMLSADDKLKLVSGVLEGKSYKSAAVEAGIHPGMIHKWVQRYLTFGYNGLVNKKRSRASGGDPAMKNDENVAPLTKAEREELLMYRARYAVEKKLQALREKKEAARLKAKKQLLSMNFEEKDTN